MTTLVEAEMTETLSASCAQILDDPYPDKTPRSILSREYLVDQRTLTGTTPVLMFPHTLWRSNTTVSKYLSLFRYYRGDMRVKIQFVSNPMIFGLIGVSVLPYTDSVTEYTTPQQQSQADMILVDVTEQTSVELDLPYVRPYTFFDRKGDVPDTFWRIVIQPFHLATITSGSPETVIATTYVTIPDIECSGYVPEGQFQMMTQRTAETANLALRFAKGYTGFVAGTMAKSVYDTANKAILSRANGAGDYLAQALGDLWTPSESTDPNTPNGDVSLQPASAPSENAKLDLFGNICSPALSSTMGTTRLGDGMATAAGKGPELKNLHHLVDLCSIPTFLASKVFSTQNDFIDISAAPIAPGSHAQYLSRMFRYYRGSCRVYLKFCTSTMVSTRMRITLFPVSPSTGSIVNVGDMPTWIHTVRGNFETCLEIPYLAAYPWKLMSDSDHPVLRVEMLTPIPQPFDKVPTVYMAAFVASGPDIAFTGLQSCVPSSLQSLFDSMQTPITNGPLLRQDYQGGITSVYQILGRFSSRAVNPATNIPVPVHISTPAVRDTLDNFDYVSNLYRFFNGECRVKVAFSKGSANGLLRTTIRNTETSATGDDFKAGNGLVMSHQAVWPMLDYTYPYQNIVPYNTIRDPIPFFAPFVGFESDVSQFLISATDTYRLHYLMPVPDFFFTALPQTAPITATDQVVALRQLRRDKLKTKDPGDSTGFQSLKPVLRAEINNYARRTVAPATTFDSLSIVSGAAIQDKEIQVTVTLSIVTTVSENIHFALTFNHLTGTSALSAFTGFGGSPTFAGVVTQKDTAYNFTWNFNSYSIQSEIYAHFLKFGPSAGSLTYSLTFSTRRIGITVAGLNAVDELVQTKLQPTSQLSLTGPVALFEPVVVEFSSTPSVSVVNPVTLVQPITAVVDLSASGPLSVVGAPNPPHPVYVSSYPDIT